MRIAVIGAKGQLGSALCRCFDSDAVPLSRSELDLTDPDGIFEILKKIDCEIVINAAAYNEVDNAEAEPEKAFAVNSLGPRFLAEYCRRNDKTLLHISTDYVFGMESTRKKPYTESEAPGPQSVYANSKLSGEYFVRDLCKKHFVIRTCGLYGKLRDESNRNFVETMLRLSKNRDELSVVNDQHCTPTYVENLVAVIERLLETDCYGLFHATNSGSTTWYELASYLFRVCGIKSKLKPISTQDYRATAKRPAYSILDCGKLERETGMTLSPWQTALEEYLTCREE